MDLGILTSSKLMTMALKGYGPFQPEAGIFCGGYQGILYPNPTTLSYPGFDPYLYTEPTPVEFTPNKTYTGLGVGNPGIDYKNPGHILGLLDTFGRMSYGIGVLQAIAAGQDGSTLIRPAFDLLLPLINSDFSDASIGLDDIYPSLTEVPSAYIDHFSVDYVGDISPNPRPHIDFRSLGFGISPIMNVVDDTIMQNLFTQKSIFSYLGIPQYFRSVIDDLSTSAQSLTTKSKHTFSLNAAEDFHSFVGRDVFSYILNDPEFEIDTTGSLVYQCKVMSATQALETLTNSSVYHNGTDGQNEYRSLTELNSVINLVPLQMISATFQKHYIKVIDDPNNLGKPDGAWAFMIVTYAIFDFVINVSDIPPDPNDPSPGQVTVAGELSMKPIITNTEAMKWRYIRQQNPVPPHILREDWEPNELDGSLTDVIFSSGETLRRDAQIQISSRNDMSWDKEWLDGESIQEDVGYSDDFLQERLGIAEPFEILDPSPFVVPFSQAIELDRGVTSIRLRAKGKIKHTLFFDSMGGKWVDPGDSPGPIGSLPEEPQWCHEHAIPPWFEQDYHCHWYLGVLDNYLLDNPMKVADDLEIEDSITLLLTVNGTRLNTILYEMSN